MELSKFKVPCSSIPKLVGNPKGNTLPTQKDLKDFITWVNKDTEKITPKQVYDMQGWILQHSQYNPKSLTDGMKDELCKIYAREFWGKGNVSTGGNPIQQQEKGFLAEGAAIELLSKIDGIQYQKNTKPFENKYFIGIPDIVLEEGGKVVKIIEIKIAYDAISYIEMVSETTCASDHFWQINGYYDVTNCRNGEVVYLLVNMPEKMIDAEKEKIILRDAKLGIPKDVTATTIERMINNMTYDDIPEVVRIHRKPVSRNHLSIKTARGKVSIVRKWLKELDAKLKKPLTLLETEQDKE